jgi:aldehyde dehydrogenase (NAD+)
MVPHLNPSTGDVQAEVAVCGAAEIASAVNAALTAQAQWRRRRADERRDALFKLCALVEAKRDEFILATALESGMPIAHGNAFVSLALSWGRYYAGWADKIQGATFQPFPAVGLGYSLHEPYGVIGAIIPWNGPLVSISMKVMPALAAGNAVVLKPPTLTPFVALLFGELALEAGLPAGLLSVVPGDSEAGEALVRHPAVGKISFTGGDAVARAVIMASSETMKPLALELGGKSANLVFDDADMAAVVPFSIARGCIALSGQGCNLPTRIYVQEKIYEEFVERAVAVTRSFTIGRATDPTAQMGPVINERACRRILAIIDRARAEGQGRLVHGGSRCGGELSRGFFLEPTLFADVHPGASLVQEEIFGPVLSILKFSSEEEVIRMANGTRYGLGAYIHTRDLDRALRVSAQMEAGYVSVNGTGGMSPNAPFGGYKQSGYGREGGQEGLTEFLQTKTVWISQPSL